jgi:ATP-dependent Clp protease ATP-binding subunit ClpC
MGSTKGPKRRATARGRQASSTKAGAKKKSTSRTSTKPGQARRRRAAAASVSPQAAQILLHLEELLHKRIHGKDDAVERIARALRVRLTNLDFRPERPNGSFLVVGPPGVGKNEFAYALADILYGDETTVIPVDLRAIASEEDVARLTDTLIPGPPTILVEGLLTTPVRRRPHSILLLRAIEQAHPSCYRLIQQIIQQGWMDDARGRVSFDRTIVFATSRIPEDEMGPTSEIGFTPISKTVEERIREKVTRRLGEELVEAFQEMIVLPPLTPEDVRRIARYKVEVVLRRLQERRRGVEVSELVYHTFIPDEEAIRVGAGSLNRTLESKILNPLARYLLEHPKERRIRLDVKNGTLVIEGGADAQEATLRPAAARTAQPPVA